MTNVQTDEEEIEKDRPSPRVSHTYSRQINRRKKINILGYDEMNIEEKEISSRITQQSRGYISMALTVDFLLMQYTAAFL